MSTVVIAFACAVLLSSEAGVSIQPDPPVQGKSLEIRYEPHSEGANLQESVPLALIYAVESRDTVFSEAESMSLNGGIWAGSVEMPDDAHSIRFVLEDSLGRRVDDSGQWFYRCADDLDGHPVPNGYLSLARFLLERAVPVRDRAREAAAREIELFPWNWAAYTWLWRSEIESPGSQDGRSRIVRGVEQLLGTAEDSIPLLYETAVVSYVEAEDLEKARGVLRRYLETSPRRRRLARILNAYFLAFLAEPDGLTRSAEEIISGLSGVPREVATYEYYFALNLAFRADDARQVLKAFITEYPTSDYMPLLLYRYVQSTTEPGTDENAMGLEDYLERFPEGPFADMAALNLARYYADSNWEEAKRYYREAIETDSLRIYLYNAFAFDCAERNVDLDEGERAILKAISLSDRNYYRKRAHHLSFEEREKMRRRDLSYLYDTCGWIKHQQGRYGESVTLLERAADLAGEGEVDPEILTHLAESYTRVNRLEQAVEAYLEILVAEPGNDSIRDLALKVYLDTGGTESDFNELVAASTSTPKERGTVAPDFAVMDLDGEEVILDELSGRVVVLNFWATWCGPCRKEIPLLNELVGSFREEDGVVFVAISSEKKRNVQAFAASNEFAYEVCYEGGDASRAYGVLYIPTHVIIDREGLIYSKHVGFTPGIGDVLEREIQEVLGRQ